MKRTVFINGQFMPATEAQVSIFDRGFLFGDAVYEVIPVYQNQVCFFDRHMRRLTNSLNSTQIAMPDCDFKVIFNELIKQNGGGDLQLYLQITRGCNFERRINLSPDLLPTVVAFTLHTPYPTSAEKKKGIEAKLIEDIRWERCDIKSTSMLGNVMVNDQAVSSGAHTALLFKDAYLTEGSSSNTFIVDENNTVRTPPLDNHCLPGITREIVIELIQQLGWSFKEDKITKNALIRAKEVWITSTTKEIMPVRKINSHQTGDIGSWEFWSKINEYYQHLISEKNDR